MICLPFSKGLCCKCSIVILNACFIPFYIFRNHNFIHTKTNRVIDYYIIKTLILKKTACLLCISIQYKSTIQIRNVITYSKLKDCVNVCFSKKYTHVSCTLPEVFRARWDSQENLSRVYLQLELLELKTCYITCSFWTSLAINTALQQI